MPIKYYATSLRTLRRVRNHALKKLSRWLIKASRSNSLALIANSFLPISARSSFVISESLRTMDASPLEPPAGQANPEVYFSITSAPQHSAFLPPECLQPNRTEASQELSLTKIDTSFKETNNASACLKNEGIRSTGYRPSISTQFSRPRLESSFQTHLAARPSPTIGQRMCLHSFKYSTAAKIA